MLKFTAYIEYLLMTRHYCYVPGHGAYMLAEDARIDHQPSLPTIGQQSARLYTLSAPRRSVRFNACHTHDDGILANLLMEAEGMSYDEAKRYIERQVPLLAEDFIDEALDHIDTEHYGMEDLHVETWADIETRLNPPAPKPTEAPAALTDTQTETISIPKVWLQRAAMALLVAIIFFSNFIGLNQSDVQQAAVIDISHLQHHEMPLSALGDEDNALSLTAYAEPASISPSIMADSASAASVSTLVGQDTPGTEPTPLNPDRYYIIVASTVSQAEAEAVCRRYAHDGYDNTGIITKDNLFRVFANAFSDKTEALGYLRTLRQSSDKLSKAWMLTLDDASLSSIIKNKYNDNQLSMELSHPNQRTERDQG